MNLYRTLYRIVALAVLGIGLALMPFLPLLMKGGEGIENLQLIYLLYLLASCHVIPAVLQERHLSGVPEGIHPQGA